mgnify:CR=1 FL=1
MEELEYLKSISESLAKIAKYMENSEKREVNTRLQESKRNKQPKGLVKQSIDSDKNSK